MPSPSPGPDVPAGSPAPQAESADRQAEPTAPVGASVPVRERWSTAGAGERYARRRFKNSRRAGRDPRLVERLLAKAGVADALVLDAPCGAGRLLPGLATRARRCVGLDSSAQMLAEIAPDAAPNLARLRGDLRRLPFRSASFDAVVCCRLLHHLADPAELAAVTAELVRVSRGVVVASFWDASSLAALRRRRTRPGALRVPRAKRELIEAFERAGARITRYAHGVRFVSQQTFLLAEVPRR